MIPNFEYADDIISKATGFAVMAHSGQYRKGRKTPSIIHAMEAAVITATMTDDQEVMAAALLHDTIEDTDATAEQIQKLFGERILQLVKGETEDKHREESAEASWYERKKTSIEELKKETDINVKIMWLGDKLSNMRSFYRDHLKEGKRMWERFNQKDEKLQEWYYREIADALSELKDEPAYQEYCYLMNQVFDGDKQ